MCSVGDSTAVDPAQVARERDEPGLQIVKAAEQPEVAWVVPGRRAELGAKQAQVLSQQDHVLLWTVMEIEAKPPQAPLGRCAGCAVAVGLLGTLFQIKQRQERGRRDSDEFSQLVPGDPVALRNKRDLTATEGAER